MKRLIAVLLVMGVVMTAFASVVINQIELKGSDQPASSTTVSLELSGNYGKVWFSEGRGGAATGTYALTMQAPNLVTNVNGNTGADNTNPKVFATSASESSGHGLYLNWNIVSTVPVSVSLGITEPMVRTGTNEESASADDKIGWSVKSGEKTISVSVNDDGTASSGGRVVVYTKDKVKYGEASSQIIDVETDNVWGKNNGRYTATLTAYIRIGG